MKEYLEISIKILGKTLLFVSVGIGAVIIIFMLFSYSTEWLWPEYNGSYNLGSGIYMIKWDGGSKLIVKGSSIRGNTCYGDDHKSPQTLLVDFEPVVSVRQLLFLFR